MENAASLEAQKEDLLEAMLEFFEEHVQQRFPKADYTFDVYITTAGRVRVYPAPHPALLDFLLCTESLCWHSTTSCVEAHVLD